MGTNGVDLAGSTLWVLHRKSDSLFPMAHIRRCRVETAGKDQQGHVDPNHTYLLFFDNPPWPFAPLWNLLY